MLNLRRNSWRSVLLVCLFGSILANCSHDIAQVKQLGPTDVVVTGADVRLGYAHQAVYDDVNHRIKAQRVFCAEPSPDVAQAIQHAFGFGLKGEGTHPSGVAAGVGLSLSDAEAQAVAQLGERIATIQLLRDALYRACEAYANGAFSEITYAVLLSRYDDTMLSSLFGELAAGTVGRELVKVGGSSTAVAATDPQNMAAIEELHQAKEAVQTASLDLQQAEAAVEEAKASGNTSNLSTLEADVADKQHNLQATSAQLQKAEATFAQLRTQATSSGGNSLHRTPNIEIARLLADMQHNHLFGINSDSLKVACVTAMAREKRNEASVLSEWCSDSNGALSTLVKKEGELLEKIVLQAKQPVAASPPELSIQAQSASGLQTEGANP